MEPVETDVGRALRLMALWRLAVLLAIVYAVLVCVGIFAALALAAYLRGPAPVPTRPTLLP